METIKQSDQIEEFSCAICLNILVEPCTVKCNHSFCKICLEEMQEMLPENQSLKCPLCRQKIKPQINEDFQVNQNLENTIKSKFPQEFAKSKQMLEEKLKFVNLCKKLKFEYGNFHKLLQTENNNCHEWTLFIKLANGNIKDFVDKVEFQLHHTFRPPNIVIKEPPFKITRLGWGVFEIPIKIYWKKTFYEKCQIPSFHETTHYLSFTGDGDRKYMIFKYKELQQQQQEQQQQFQQQ